MAAKRRLMAEKQKDETTAFAESTAAFAANLHQLLSATSENLLFSPTSVAIALGMTLSGADGNTLQQIKQAIFKGVADEDAIHEACEALISSFNSPQSDYVLRVANTLCVQKDYPIFEDFIYGLENSYHTSLQSVDFKNNTEMACAQINQWASAATNEKIPKIIEADDDDAKELKFALLNAIYFKGNWKVQFSANRSRQETFYVSSKKEVQVTMMHQTHYFRYADNDEIACQVLGMPYVGESLFFFVILPKKRFGLATLQPKLTGKMLLNAMQSTRHCTFLEINVTMPKFKLESTFDLNGPLKTLGLTDMFTDAADFSRITSALPPLYVSKVTHKAFIEVNEEGSEAAAITLVRGRCCSGKLESECVDFTANHPFLYAIVDVHRWAILFLGKLSNPQ